MPDPGKPLLDLRGWSLDRRADAGSVPLLRDFDLLLEKGSWVAVAGANGSGKSSLLKYLASAGSPLVHRSAMLLQDPDEQFVAGSVAGEWALGRRDCDNVIPAAFGLEGMGDMDPRLLSAGQKQRLALAVAVAARPEVLICDEPTSLQDEIQAVWVLDFLERWRRETGGTLLTATCDRREAARADRLLILADGRVAASGTPAALLDDPAWSGLFFDVSPLPADGIRFTDSQGSAAEPLALSLHDVGCRFGSGGGFFGVHFDLPVGGRLGICGPNGCGKSTLLAVCAGARRPDTGRVTLGGQRLYTGRGLDTDHGRALLAPQFPEYLFTQSTVAGEIRVDPVLGELDVEAFLADLGLRGEMASRNPHDLSSGQKRRLALGLVLRSQRPLLLLDEPTAALDGAGHRLVGEMVASAAKTSAVVVASHDRAFLASIGCEVMDLEASGWQLSGPPTVPLPGNRPADPKSDDQR